LHADCSSLNLNSNRRATDHFKPFVHSFTRQSVKGELIGHKLIRDGPRSLHAHTANLAVCSSPQGGVFAPAATAFIGFYVDTHSPCPFAVAMNKKHSNRNKKPICKRFNCEQLFTPELLKVPLM
jgi:hypothetical protein